MKILLFFLFTLCALLSGRPASAQRYLPRQIGLQLTGGMVDGMLLRDRYLARRFHAGMAFSRYNRNQSRWIVGVDYLLKDYRYKTERVPKVQISAEAGYFLPLVSNRGKDIFLSVGLSALAGYEISNGGSKRLSDGAILTQTNAFVYGGVPALELETFLCDRVVILLNVRQRILFGSPVGHFHTLIGFGLKFIMN